MLIHLEKRRCLLGVYCNTPSQVHGDERVPAKVIALKNLMLTKTELNELLVDAHAWDALYVERKGKPAEPLFAGKVGPFTRLGKFKNSHLELTFGLKPYEVTFDGATFKSLKLEPQTGGLTALSFTVVCLKSNVSGNLSNLDDHLGMQGDCEIEIGDPENEDDDEDADQESLDLDHSNSANASANGETPKPKRNRRPSDGAALN